MTTKTDAAPGARAKTAAVIIFCDRRRRGLPPESTRHVGLACWRSHILAALPDPDQIDFHYGCWQGDGNLARWSRDSHRSSGCVSGPRCSDEGRKILSHARSAIHSHRRSVRPAFHVSLCAQSAQLEIFAAGSYTFSRVRYLEAFSGAASRIAAG